MFLNCVHRSASVLTFVGVLFLGLTVHADEDVVKKEDLSAPEANAEILLLQEKGFGLRELKVKSDGKEARFGLVFAKNGAAGKYFLAATHQDVDREHKIANERGGVRFTHLQGYVVNGTVFFAFITAVDGPAGSGVRYKIFRDVPPGQLNNIVEGERSLGGRLVDDSTYVVPGAGTFHTLVFHPK